MATILFTACTQDELAEQGNTLPEGEYPLQIGSVSITAESSEEPWTRVAENTADGMGSHWTGGERIGVRIGNNEETGIYTIKVDDAGNVTVTPETPVYWKSTQPATVTAWYPVDETIDFTQQGTKGLTYLLKGTSNADASYKTPATLTFAHQLAKVRVKLEGNMADKVQAVTVHSSPTAPNNQGTLGTSSGTPQYVPMLQSTYNGTTYWEANLIGGTLQAGTAFQVSTTEGKILPVTLANDVTIAAAQVHTVTVNVSGIPSDAQEVTGEISGNGNYVVSGTFKQAITITGGSPNIYLDDASISVNGTSAISILNGANPTFHVVGTNNNIVSTSSGVTGYAGISVAENSGVTITADNPDCVLTIRGSNGGAGIGGSKTSASNFTNSGNITIQNVTVYAYGSTANAGALSAGIGCAGDGTCGTITITDAMVHAYGAALGSIYYSPGIGTGLTNGGFTTSSLPQVSISNSTIHAHRGGVNADYIGWAGDRGTSSIQTGGGTCTGSTIYCYTGNGNTVDKTIVYDASGNGTEQSQ